MSKISAKVVADTSVENVEVETVERENSPEKSEPVFDRSKFRTVKHVTLPLLKITPEKEYYIRVDSLIETAKEIKGVRAKTAAQEAMLPPQLANVTNLVTGELMQMIFPSVLCTELIEQYENGSYVGKCYMIIKHEKATGKRYATFTIEEIAPV